MIENGFPSEKDNPNFLVVWNYIYVLSIATYAFSSNSTVLLPTIGTRVLPSQLCRASSKGSPINFIYKLTLVAASAPSPSYLVQYLVSLTSRRLFAYDWN